MRRCLLLIALALPLTTMADEDFVSRVPGLAEALAQQGWRPTPQASSAYRVGDLVNVDTRRLSTEKCFPGAQPITGTRVDASIGQHLKAEGTVRLGIVKANVGGMKYRKTTMAEPFTEELDELDLDKLSAECRTFLSTRGTDGWEVITGTLSAKVSEKLCKSLDGGANIPKVSVGAEVKEECVEESNGHVTIAYKTRPVTSLVRAQPGPVTPPQVSGQTNGSGSGGVVFDTSATLAQIQAAKDLEARLNKALDDCLVSEERRLLSEAASNAAALAPLMKETGAKARELTLPQVKKFVEVYGAARVSCKNELGTRSKPVAIGELSAMKAYLEAPASSGAVAGGGWIGKSGYAMKVVPAGTYSIGCTPGQWNCQDDEMPAHTVEVTRAFLMGTTEVTQELWLRVMGTAPWEQAAKDCFKSGKSAVGVNQPVYCVSWVEATTFANSLSKADGLESCYVITGSTVMWPTGLSCSGYRLPTEAEWEVAARGGHDTLYAGGNEPNAVGWTTENSGGNSQNVGTRAGNGYGLFDMTGNLWEWVWDWYATETYRSRFQRDPIGPPSGSVRVGRGGSWSNSAIFARVSDRDIGNPGVRANIVGFRLARTVP